MIFLAIVFFNLGGLPRGEELSEGDKGKSELTIGYGAEFPTRWDNQIEEGKGKKRL